MAAILNLWLRSSICLVLLAALESGSVAQTDKGGLVKNILQDREHHRIEKVAAPGRRVDLSALKGATLYVSPLVRLDKPVPLVVHFHGAAWLVEQHIRAHLPNAALITVQLGAGSSVYGRPFEEEALFSKMIEEARESAGARHGWSSITLTAFSAGYGAVRSILRHPEYFQRINGVLLLDGFHASYQPEGKALADGGIVSHRDIDSYVAFAREAVKGRKHFVITHSQIHPGSYASTTECTNELLRELRLERRMAVRVEPMGMRQVTKTGKGSFRVFGYAGETAADHVDHLHAMPFWFAFLGVR